MFHDSGEALRLCREVVAIVPTNADAAACISRNQASAASPTVGAFLRHLDGKSRKTTKSLAAHGTRSRFLVRQTLGLLCYDTRRLALPIALR